MKVVIIRATFFFFKTKKSGNFAGFSSQVPIKNGFKLSA